jgi:hypothetical protein
MTQEDFDWIIAFMMEFWQGLMLLYIWLEVRKK